MADSIGAIHERRTPPLAVHPKRLLVDCAVCPSCDAIRNGSNMATFAKVSLIPPHQRIIGTNGDRVSIGDNRTQLVEYGALAVSILFTVGTAFVRMKSGSVWLDEAYSLSALNNFHLYVQSDGGDMIGYVLFLIAWSHISSTVVGLRIPSMLFSCGTLFLTWRLGRYFIRGWVLACALILLSLFGYFQWQAALIRGYSLETLVTVACWLVIVRVAGSEPPPFARWLPKFAVLACIGVFAHGLFVLQVLPMVLFLILKSPTKRTSCWAAIYLAPSFLAFGVLSILPTKDVGTFTPGGPVAWIGSLISAGFGTNRVARLILLLIVSWGLWLVVRNRLEGKRSHKNQYSLIPVLWSIIPPIGLGIASFVVNVFNPRYLLPCFPALALLLAQCVEAIAQWLSSMQGFTRALTRGATYGIVAILLLSLKLGQPASSSFGPSHDREMVTIIQHQLRPGDCLYFSTDVPKSAGGVARPPFEAEWIRSTKRSEIRPYVLRVISSDRPLGEVLRSTPTFDLNTSLRLGM